MSAEYNTLEEGRYRPLLKSQTRSQTMRKIWMEAYGDDYPEEASPFGFVTRTDLSRIIAELALSTDQVLVDVGCGLGGPGLLVAKASGVRLIGLDIVEEAVQQARMLIAPLGVSHASFAIGSFTATGLADRLADGVMSVDALWMVIDKAAAMREIARILKPGGRFVFTTWEPFHVKHAALLKAAGFEVAARMETPRWLERQLHVYRSVLEHEEDLKAELGEGAAILIAEARESPQLLAATPRVMITAVRNP